AEIADFAQFTAFDDFLRQFYHRVFQIVEADSRLYTLSLCCECHFETLGCSRRKRLFTIYVLACLNSGECHFLVKPIWRCNVDEIDIRIGNQSRPIASGIFKTQSFRSLSCYFRIYVGQCVKLGFYWQVEDTVYVREREGM